MLRTIPAYCANCGAAVPRAAAGRCPSCRVGFDRAGTRATSQSLLGCLARENGFAQEQPTGPRP